MVIELLGPQAPDASLYPNPASFKKCVIAET